jgi:HNH endonuclease
MDAALSNLVRQRAANRCEYCGLHQDHDEWSTFHVEHIVAKQHGGSDEEWNLALACQRCNLHKGPNLTGIDPDSGRITPLFHPRQHCWHDHFSFQGCLILGRTPVGRTTVQVLNMNAPQRIELRLKLLAGGEQCGPTAS